MAQWGNKRQPVSVNATSTVETTDGAPMGIYPLVRAGGGANAHLGNTSGTRANTDLNMYKAQTPFPTLPGMKVSVIPVSPSDVNNPNNTPAPVLTQTLSVSITDNGQGYRAPVTADAVFANGYTGVGFFTGAVANGNLNTLTQTVPSPIGTVFTSTPTVNNLTSTYHMNITASNNVGFNNATDQILVANADGWLLVNDTVFYSVPAGDTPIAPLGGNTYYYIAQVNSTGFQLKSSVGGPVINITDTRVGNTQINTFFGKEAVLGAVVVANSYTGPLGAGGVASPVSHAGWVVRREGTGGRAGRVQYETLVAMGSISNT